ncbi:omega-hydroxypalmitate O-feruloyl transferase-like, partial [Trifolium medium]|nr:omega-hydroxypalmitate O-feruloyl transferase-like [Trifolium medium]
FQEQLNGFVGNALVPGFARAIVKELIEVEDGFVIRKVQEGNRGVLVIVLSRRPVRRGTETEERE